MRIKDTRVEPGTWVVGLAVLGLGAFVGLVYLPLEAEKSRLEQDLRVLDGRIDAARSAIAKTDMDETQLADRKEALTRQLATMREQQTLSYLFQQVSRCNAAMAVDVNSMVPGGKPAPTRGGSKCPSTGQTPECLVEPCSLLVQMRTRFRNLPEYLNAVESVPGLAFVKNLTIAVPTADGPRRGRLASGDLLVRMTVTAFAYNEPGTQEGARP